MIAQPIWDDSGQGDLLALVAAGSPATPSADEDWELFVGCLQVASQLDCGPILPNTLRPMVRGQVAPKRIAAFTSRAIARGLIEPTGDWEISDDTEGRNAGRPARCYRWIGDAA
jgi:hypothetical protein